MFQELTVDLRRPPGARWHLTPAQREQARELFVPYKADLGLRPDVSEFLVSSARTALCLRFAYYDLCHIHRGLRVTPAMEAGITDHVWEISEILQ